MPDSGVPQFSKCELFSELDALAQEMNVNWPAWFVDLIQMLVQSMSDPTEDLPGGFLSNSAQEVYDDTQNYRGGQFYFHGIDGYRGKTYPSIYDDSEPFPHSYVVVGATGNSYVMIDCDGDKPVLWHHDQKGEWLEPLIDLEAAGLTPKQLAERLVESDQSGNLDLS